MAIWEFAVNIKNILKILLNSQSFRLIVANISRGHKLDVNAGHDSKAKEEEIVSILFIQGLTNHHTIPPI